MNAKIATLNLRRRDSSDLEQIDISASGPTSKFYARFAKKGRAWNTLPFVTPQDNFLDEEDLNSICKSWCMGMRFFIACRAALFQYLFASFVVLITRDGLQFFPLSMFVYAIQLSAAFAACCSSCVFLWSSERDIRDRRGYLTPPADKSQTRANFHPSRVSRVINRLRRSVGENAKTALLVFSAMMAQNAATIVVYWDLLFWTSGPDADIENMISSRKIDFVLLHLYNLIPILFELLFSCTVFKLIYFVPGVAIVAGILLRVSIAPENSTRAGEELYFVTGINLHSLPETLSMPFVQLSIIFVTVCSGMLLFQRMKRRAFER